MGNTAEVPLRTISERHSAQTSHWFDAGMSMFLVTDAGDDYGVPEELEYWAVRDFEDVLPSCQSITSD